MRHLHSVPYICHYGVKGMKWGVRRYQNKDGSLTSEGRKRYSQTDLKKAIESSRKNKSYKETMDEQSSIRFVGGVLNPGTKLYRITSNENESNEGRKFVTFSNRDVDYYESVWPDYVNGPAKQVEYTVTKPLKIAGTRDVIDSMVSLNSRFSELKLSELDDGRGYYDSLISKNPELATMTVKQASEKLTPETVNDFAIITSSAAGGYDFVNEQIYDKIGKDLQKKGFDGSVDVADSEIWGEAEFSTVIFSSEGTEKTKIRDQRDWR